VRSAPLTYLLDGDIFYRTVRFIVHRRSGWGHNPSSPPAEPSARYGVDTRWSLADPECSIYY
jgi:hypothetical protein